MLTLLCLLAADPATHAPVVPKPPAERTLADYPLTGEYLAVVSDPEGGEVQPRGLQVRPLPDAGGRLQYEFVSYFGGLPGSGWDGSVPERQALGVDIATFNLREVRQGYFKITRQSPTMGLPVPEEGTVLFDAGAPSLDAWQDGAELQDGYLKAGARTKDNFEAMRLHLEYRLPFQPEKLDTWRGNSGAYVQDRYEVQVLDSFGDIIRENGAGSIYRLHTPPINAALPPGQWQTLDILFRPAAFAGNLDSEDDYKKTRPARMSVALNGVVLFHDVDVSSVTNGNHLPETPKPGPILLQDHGDPVVYRNVWVAPADRDF